MPDIIAIISKPIFEVQAAVDGKLRSLGSVLPLDRYNSKNKGLLPLTQGGRLVLVTVRPPNERLWLVAILENLSQDATGFVAKAPNQTKLTDISALRKTIKLASGKGVSQEKGALAMSLQTPRALAEEDITAISNVLSMSNVSPISLPETLSPKLRKLAEDVIKEPENEALCEKVGRELLAEGYFPLSTTLLRKLKHVNRHEGRGDVLPSGALPCLCKTCIVSAPLTIEKHGLSLRRDLVVAQGRVLHFWAPLEIFSMGNQLTHSVRAALHIQLTELARARKQRARAGAEARSLARKKQSRTKKKRSFVEEDD